MWYVGFDKRVTLKYGVVLENWPLQKFGPPGNFCSIPVLNTLKAAFEENRAVFRAMDNTEWAAWKAAYHAGQNPIAVTWVPTAAATASAQESSDAPSLGEHPLANPPPVVQEGLAAHMGTSSPAPRISTPPR